jgi:ADP-heptose:LPS heptosyltransferase
VGYDWGWPARLFAGRVPFLAEAGEVDRYLAFLPAAGLEPEAAEPTLRVPERLRAEAGALWKARGLEGCRVAGLFPGGGANPGTVLLAKRWTAQGWAALGRRLKSRGFSLAIFGGPDDEKDARALAEACEGAELFCAGVDLPLRLALLERLVWFAGGDSGLTHIAAALGVPTLSLFGPSAPRHWAPRGPRHAQVWRALECSPCYTPAQGLLPAFAACQGYPCLQALTPEAVLDAAEAHLARLGL